MYKLLYFSLHSKIFSIIKRMGRKKKNAEEKSEKEVTVKQESESSYPEDSEYVQDDFYEEEEEEKEWAFSDAEFEDVKSFETPKTKIIKKPKKGESLLKLTPRFV